jgi:hypothetical protein
MNNTRNKNLVLCAVCMSLTNAADALEGGATAYPPGIVTVMSGNNPPPGKLHIYSYNQLLKVRQTRDNNGDKVFPKVKGDVQANALQFAYTLEDVSFLGGNVTALLALPYFKGDMHIPALGEFGRGTSSGPGDSTLSVAISWPKPGFLHKVELSYIHPTGKYDEDRIINSGNNTKVVYGSYASTWFPVERFEVSQKTSLLYSFENPATKYQSGVQVAMDYGFNYYATKRFMAGVGGYLMTQLNDDYVNDENYGYRSRGFKMGPQIGYGGKGWGVMTTYQFDLYGRNVAKGDGILVSGFMEF